MPLDHKGEVANKKGPNHQGGGLCSLHILYHTFTPWVSFSEVPVCDTENEAVKNDGDDDWQDDGQPNFDIWPCSITPFFVLLDKHADKTDKEGEDVDESQMNVLLDASDLKAGTAKSHDPGYGDVKDMVAGTGLDEIW